MPALAPCGVEQREHQLERDACAPRAVERLLRNEPRAPAAVLRRSSDRLRGSIELTARDGFVGCETSATFDAPRACAAPPCFCSACASTTPRVRHHPPSKLRESWAGSGPDTSKLTRHLRSTNFLCAFSLTGCHQMCLRRHVHVRRASHVRGGGDVQRSGAPVTSSQRTIALPACCAKSMRSCQST